jgi:uncharacterized membrane protein
MSDQTSSDALVPGELWQRLKPSTFVQDSPPVRNANDEHEKRLTKLDKAALWITGHVGSMGFFLFILGWTILWCGYNIFASELPSLGWKSFDPFPAFVAYLLISNVIQILLMPLIMVGQNVQSLHSDIRAELDFEVNQKAEKEVMAILRTLENNTDLLIQLMRHMNCKVDEEQIRAVAAEKALSDKIANEKKGASA